MAANPGALDEGLLASCYSWMRKASDDKLDGGCWPKGGVQSPGRRHSFESRMRLGRRQGRWQGKGCWSFPGYGRPMLQD